MSNLTFLPTMVLLGALAAASPLPAVRRAIYPIGAQQVAKAISAQGVAVSAGQIEFLASVVSSQAAPTLQVVALEPWGDLRSKVLLACHEAAQCLPFYVAVKWDEKRNADLGLQQWKDSPRTKGSRPERRQKPIIRAGQPATLMIESGRIHMQLPVICLESGPLGANIRVTSKDRKRIFVAEVMDRSTVKGGIE